MIADVHNDGLAGLTNVPAQLLWSWNDGDFVHALVVHHVQRNEWDAAIRYAKALVALAPDDPRAKQLLRAVQRRGQR